jgi:hypothetical protein
VPFFISAHRSAQAGILSLPFAQVSSNLVNAQTWLANCCTCFVHQKFLCWLTKCIPRIAMPDKRTGFNYEDQLSEALKQIVCGRLGLDTAIESANIPASDKMGFSVILGDTLGDLNEHNCADYGLSEKETIAWINDGRPAGAQPSAPVPDGSEDPGAVIPDNET